MSVWRQAKHTSHLPVLELIFKHSNIKDVFEYGCGDYSTKFFVDHAQAVTSVEMNKKAWYEKVKSNIASDNLNIMFIDGGPASIEYFKSTDKVWDLVFVDGDRVSRKDCVINAFGKAEIIAVHDIHLTWKRCIHRGWKNIVVPDIYKIITMDFYPGTTVYTLNKSLFEELKKHPKGIVIRA